MWKIDGKEGNETAKVHHRIAPFVYGHGLDLGCGAWPLKVEKTRENSCLGVDAGYAVWGTAGAELICDVTRMPMLANESFDYVYSSHTLEDMIYPEAVLAEWWRLIKVGGKLILYLPLTRNVAKTLGVENWEGYYPNKGEQGANPAHSHDYSPAEITAMVGRVGHAEMLVDEIRGEFDEYSFLQVYTKLASASLPVAGVEVNKQKRALVVRYGAIGDVIQSTPVFRRLKEDGYHVTFNCSPLAKEILQGNPHVDEFAVQIKDYVPNYGRNLEVYWKEISQGYDKFINLTGAAEGDLLQPDRDVYKWMDEIRTKNPGLDEKSVFYNTVVECRRRAGDTNYYDKHLEKAGYTVENPRGELFFTEPEDIMARTFRELNKDRFIILWAVAGSSYHKLYPYFSSVVQELTIRNPDVLIISTGDAGGKILERKASAKYMPRAGEWTLRTSMLMTKYVDLVIGPETGILNAAGCFDTPKITFLSHSGHNNFCKYFKNDYCLAPVDTFCHPCHMLHYTHQHGPAKCGACDNQTAHPVPAESDKREKAFQGGFWSCPYTEAGADAGIAAGVQYPICCSTGMPPKRVLARINEVYTKWKASRAGLVQLQGI